MAAVVLAVGVLAWQKQDQLKALISSAPPITLPDLPRSESSAAAPTSASKSKFAPGAMRKCVKGQQVSYTNVECPAGTQEQAVTAAPVNVVQATPVPKPAQAAQASSGPAALREALDMKREETLREKAMDRAVEGIR